MATAPDFPVLARRLDNNAKWASAVNAAEPTFFANCAKGQAPKVCNAPFDLYYAFAHFWM